MTVLTVTVTVTDSNGHFATDTENCTIGSLTDYQMREAIAPSSDLFSIGWNDYDIHGPVGALADVSRTVWTGSHALVPGTTYENKIIPFDISPPDVANPLDPANDVILKNCEIIGTPTLPGGNTALIRAWGQNHARLRIWDSTIKPQLPNIYYNGYLGHDVDMYRCLTEDVCDTVSVYNTYDPDGPIRSELLGSVFRQHAWYSHADLLAGNPSISSNADGAHPDGIQIQGGSGLRIVGCRFTGQMGWAYGVPFNGQANSPTNPGRNYYGGVTANAAAMIKPDVGLITGLDIHHSYFGGGGFTINITNDGTARVLGNIGSISDCRFGRDQRSESPIPPATTSTGPGGDNTYTIFMPPNVLGAFDRNVYEDNGHPIKVRHTGA